MSGHNAQRTYTDHDYENGFEHKAADRTIHDIGEKKHSPSEEKADNAGQNNRGGYNKHQVHGLNLLSGVNYA